MIDNVFSPSFGNRPSQLVGREDILNLFQQALAAQPGSRDRALLLLGQRGYGKTVLLWELADCARDTGFVVASPTTASFDMTQRIIEKIQDDGQRYISEKERRVSGGSVGALGFSMGLQFTQEVQDAKSFQFKLTKLCRRLNDRGHGLAIFVDEVQASSDPLRQLAVAYQELVGEGANIALVMAGLPGAMSATLNDRVMTFLNRARKKTLPPLPIHDVETYLSTVFRKLGVILTEQQIYNLAQATEGSPYLLQLVGHNIVAATEDNGFIANDAIDVAIQRAQSDFVNDVCKTILVSLSDRDISFLKAMALDSAESKTSEIAERLGTTPDYAQKYRIRLIDSGVIESHRRGYVRFAVPYLAEYLSSLE
ncbi:MAG: ATP-binding protein [Atopobiaceae bacterium]|nr:ATP-binding protein [Atopobiaceae bacterium]